jgi:anti-sigma factor (TIGR02949 family)
MSEEIKKIECDEAIRKMLEYLDNELHSHDNDALESHFETCRSCYSRMEFEKRLKSMVNSVESEPATNSLRDRIKKITDNF